VASIEGPKDTVQRIKFKGEQKEKLREYLRKEMHTCELERGRLLEKCKLWVQQANSRRQRKDVKARDSNIDMPMTRQRMIQNSSRLMNPIFQQDVLFIARPRNPVVEDMARSVERLIDWISDNIDYRSLCDDWIEQFQTFPFGVVKTPFIQETERIKKWVEIQGVDEFNQRKLDGQKVTLRRLKDGTEKYFLEVDEEVPVRVGAFPEVIPFEDFIVPMSAVDVRTADWVTHRIWMTKPTVEARIRAKVYDSKDDGSDILEALGEPKAERERLLRLGDRRDKQMELDDNAKQYEICETYLKWAVNENEEPLEIIVTYEKSSMVILRAVYNFYHSYQRPFVTSEYKKVQGSIFGLPLTYILEPLHVAYSASFNQRLDQASKANEPILAVPTGSAENMRQIDRDSVRACLLEMDDPSEMQKVEISQAAYTQLPELEARLEKEADKLSSLSDYSFGQEQIDRPTATGQVQIIEESKQPQYMMLERFRAGLAEVCKHVLARYRQFYPEGLEFYYMQESPEGAQMTQQFFQWPEGAIEKDVIVETKVSSANMSKNLRKQEMVALMDKLNQYYQQLMGLAQAAVDPMNPTALIAAHLMNGLYTLMNDMLIEFEVGKKDALNPQLMEVTQVAQQINAQMQQLMQQVNQLGAQNQQLQAANAQLQAVAAGQQPGVAGPPGPQPGMQGPMPGPAPPQGPGNQQIA
jgi:hypothetical protein